jgi:hypothetical protein
MSISVIGAGLGRTGTSSLKAALEILGLGPCYHMVEVFGKPDHLAFWTRAGHGDLGNFDAVFAGYGSSCDWPSARWYKEQADRYPDAKVILTVRDADAWFRSTQATIFAERPGGPPDPAFGAMIQAVVFDSLDGGRHDRDKAVAFFERHNAEVKRTIPAERLLVYDAAQGWDPLCDFLGVAVPDLPFPKNNTTEEFQARSRQRQAAAEKV